MTAENLATPTYRFPSPSPPPSRPGTARSVLLPPRRVSPGEGHDGVIDAGADDAMTFITDQYEHQAATSTC